MKKSSDEPAPAPAPAMTAVTGAADGDPAEIVDPHAGGDSGQRPSAGRSVSVKAPAKVNLALVVGPIGRDGYHPLATVFHALDIFDTVTATACLPSERGLNIHLDGVVGDVPADTTNLAWRAVDTLARQVGRSPDVRVDIDKRIPVAAGLAGGSADAAAALVACNELWETGLEPAELSAIAATLGSDVAFALFGGTMLGLGRGEQLSPVLAKANLRWVVAVSDDGLSTAAVYQRLDGLRAGQLLPVEADEPTVPRELMTALAAGEVEVIGENLVNDLSAAAFALKPALRRTLDVGAAAGALGAVLSGSGPTCCFLAADDEAAVEISVALMSEGVCDRVMQARGPVPGALANIRIGGV